MMYGGVFLVLTIFCFASSVDPNDDYEIVVIVGGTNGTVPHSTTEIYNYYGSTYLTCSDGNPPEIPDFPIAIQGASAVYLPNTGIYICGGHSDSEVNRDCYKYNPFQNPG